MTETEKLLAALRTDPVDDAPRHALAEYLVRRGDPRGKLIRLQYRLLQARPTSSW